MRQICDLPEYADQPPVRTTPGSRKVDPDQFESVHMPVFTEEKKNCVVCYRESKSPAAGAFNLQRSYV